MQFVVETEQTDTSGIEWVDFSGPPIGDILNQNDFKVMRLTLDSTITAFMHTESENVYSGILTNGDTDTFMFSATKGSNYGITLRHLDYTSFDVYVEKFVEGQIYDTDGNFLRGFTQSGFGFIEGERTVYINDFNYSGDSFLILTLRRADNFVSDIDSTYKYTLNMEVLNNGPTGLPSVLGIAAQGYELLADTSNITDLDGLGELYFRWLRDGISISGANNQTYTVTEDDLGRDISVRVSYIDGGGTTETIVSDTIEIFSAAENVTLSDLNDEYTSTDRPEVIAARGGNDFITASKGNDRIDGGLGIDTVLYDGDQNSYTVTLTSSGVQVRDRRTDGNGTDTLTNTEFLVFDAGPYAEFNLTQFGGAASLNEEAFRGFIELYIAYYNRAPDAIGLNFWGTAYANGTSMEEMATLFAGQSETLRFYPENTSNAEFAEAVYNNVLGRTPDQAGFDFWVNSLNSGFVSRHQFILEVLGGVQDGSTDRVYLDNKVNVGAYFAVHKGLSDTSEAAIAMALYDGSDLSLQSVKQTVDSFYAAALDPLNGGFLMPLVGVLADPFA